MSRNWLLCWGTATPGGARPPSDCCWSARTAQPFEPLRQLLVASKEPLARVHAVSLLAGLRGLEDKTLLPLLRDSHPRMHEQAVLLAEDRLKNSAALANGSWPWRRIPMPASAFRWPFRWANGPMPGH